jgi:CubicO group peptidase (beta-lactamase class C family)
MYLVAGQIIEALTSQSWDDFVRERIFKPLGMSASTTTIPNLQHNPNVVTPHAVFGGVLQQVAHRNYENVGPAASIYSSVAELAQLMRLFLNAGTVDDVQLVDAARIAELWSAQMVITIETPHQELAMLTPQFYAYALGWFVRDYRGHKLITHSGGVDGMTALVTMVPNAGLGIVVLLNSESPLIGPITYRLLDHYLGLPHTDLLPSYHAVYEKRKTKLQAAEQQRTAARVPNTSPSLPLADYAGTYHDQLYGDAAVRQEGGHLVLEFSATPSFTGDLTHWHYDTFLITWRDPVIPSGLASFPLNAEGRVAAMEFAQPKLLDVDFEELHFRRVQPNLPNLS